MQLLAQYIRIYALCSTTPTTPRSHVASPVRLLDFPSRGIQSEIHLGAIPDGIMEALRFQRAWIEQVFRGGCKSADELRGLAANISEEAILAEGGHGRKPFQPHWFVTLCIDDQIELPESLEQELLGVATRPWVDLDNRSFFDKHVETLDQLAVQMAISVAPYRYRWRVWDGPIVHLPTGVALRPPQLRMGRVRAFGAPSLETINLSALSTASATALMRIPMVLHFYLRSVAETDRIYRFFDAFRGLEGLCQSLKTSLRSKASSHSAVGIASARKAIQVFRETKNSLRKSFAIMSLALNPTEADADLDMFIKLNKWRVDLAHGKRKLQSDDAPDEEAFELLHKYIAKVM